MVKLTGIDGDCKIDPPWRLDPLQTIVDFHIPDGDADGNPPPKNDPELPPGWCSCLVVAFPIDTCFCPGIFCWAPNHPLIPYLIGYTTYPCDTCGCASGTWVHLLISCIPNSRCPGTGVPPGWVPPPGMIGV